VEATHRSPRASWRVVAVVAAALVYAWIASGLRPFTHPEAVAVGIPIIAAGVATLASALRAPVAAGPESRRGVLVWRGLLAAFLIWELISYRSSPPRYATLGSIVRGMMRHPFMRWAVWASWAFVGWHLFVRGRGAFK
jgi:hypothetical protein